MTVWNKRIKAGEYEINILDEEENVKNKETVKRMKWECISGGNEIDILETALPNFAQGILFFTFWQVKSNVRVQMAVSIHRIFEMRLPEKMSLTASVHQR